MASREPVRRRVAAPGATGAKRVELSHGYWRRSWAGLKLLVAGVRRGGPRRPVGWPKKVSSTMGGRKRGEGRGKRWEEGEKRKKKKKKERKREEREKYPGFGSGF